MTSDESSEGVLDAFVTGLNKDKADLTSVVGSLTKGSKLRVASETIGLLKRLATEETPSDPEKINEMSKDEVIITIYRINLFEKLRHPALDDKQIEQIYQRTVDLWGRAPSEPIGRWAEWNLWVTLHRRRNSIAITEVVMGDKKVEDIKKKWVERHQAREDRRNYHKMQNYERYDFPEDVPPGLRQIIFSPFIEDEEDLPDLDLSEELEINKETEQEKS